MVINVYQEYHIYFESNRDYFLIPQIMLSLKLSCLVIDYSK